MARLKPLDAWGVNNEVLSVEMWQQIRHLAALGWSRRAIAGELGVSRNTVAQAYRRLYKLERVCRAQVLAMSTGRPLEVLSDDIVAQVQAPAKDDRHSSVERERLFFEAMMRIVDRELPGYRD